MCGGVGDYEIYYDRISGKNESIFKEYSKCLSRVDTKLLTQLEHFKSHAVYLLFIKHAQAIATSFTERYCLNAATLLLTNASIMQRKS